MSLEQLIAGGMKDSTEVLFNKALEADQFSNRAKIRETTDLLEQAAPKENERYNYCIEKGITIE